MNQWLQMNIVFKIDVILSHIFELFYKWGISFLFFNFSLIEQNLGFEFQFFCDAFILILSFWLSFTDQLSDMLSIIIVNVPFFINEILLEELVSGVYRSHHIWNIVGCERLI